MIFQAGVCRDPQAGPRSAQRALLCPPTHLNSSSSNPSEAFPVLFLKPVLQGPIPHSLAPALISYTLFLWPHPRSLARCALLCVLFVSAWTKPSPLGLRMREADTPQMSQSAGKRAPLSEPCVCSFLPVTLLSREGTAQGEGESEGGPWLSLPPVMRVVVCLGGETNPITRKQTGTINHSCSPNRRNFL